MKFMKTTWSGPRFNLTMIKSAAVRRKGGFVSKSLLLVPRVVANTISAPSRYERKLMALLDDLIKEMDKKIIKAKERAEKESAPRELRSEDKARLEDIQLRAKGMFSMPLSLAHVLCMGPDHNCPCRGSGEVASPWRGGRR